MERVITMRQALNEALDHEMGRDPAIIMLGEDIIGGTGTQGEEDAWGGVQGVSKGLVGKYPDQIIDTPLSEMAYVGAAVGAASAGLRPIAELMYVDFIGVCLDPILNQAAKARYMFGGRADTPVVFRMMCGAGGGESAQHSQMLTPLFTHVPGLKVVCPSTPHDAKGLLIEAIRDNDPVIFMEHKQLYDTSGHVPSEAYAIPFGKAAVRQEGDDVTIVSYGLMASRALDAAAMLRAEGVRAEVIDLRTLSPIDMPTILESVRKTGRLVCVDEANPRCSIAADVAANVVQDGFDALRAPVRLVTPPHVPVPFSPALEHLYLPSDGRIADAVREIIA